MTTSILLYVIIGLIWVIIATPYAGEPFIFFVEILFILIIWPIDMIVRLYLELKWLIFHKL